MPQITNLQLLDAFQRLEDRVKKLETKMQENDDAMVKFDRRLNDHTILLKKIDDALQAIIKFCKKLGLWIAGILASVIAGVAIVYLVRLLVS